MGTDVLQRSAFADGLQQAVAQTLVGIGQSGKVVGGQAHQCRQHGVFQTGLIHKGLSLCQSVLQKGSGAFGQIGQCLFGFTFPQQLTDVGGRGVFSFCAFIMTGTHTGNGEDVYRRLPADQRLAVFNGKNVVGLLQNLGLFLHTRVQRTLPGGGVGNAGFEMH